MKLKKFREYPFTENTEALVKDCWYKVYGYKIHYRNENLNYLHLEKNNSCQVIFSVIQELREKPKEIYINVYEDGAIEKLDTMISVLGNGDIKLLKCFKGIKCDLDELQTKINCNKIWFACNYSAVNLFNIYYGDCLIRGNIRYSTEAIDSKDKKYYILELLYDSEKEPEIPDSVLKDYLPPEQESKNVFSKEQHEEIYKLISDWFHSFIKECELITKEQVK